MKIKKPLSLFIVFLVYAVAFAAVYFSFDYLPGETSIWKVFYADLLATGIVFAASFLLKNSSMYDPYWSVIPPFIAGYLMLENPEGNLIRQYLVFGLTMFWAVRLTLNWARGWHGMHEQDWRYDDLAKKSGAFYWLVSLSGIHVLPTIWVFLGCLPMWYAMGELGSNEALNWIDYVAVLITAGAVFIEWISDEQLKIFKKKAEKTEFIKTGLWGISRHPNYFGEITFWLGIFLFGYAAAGQAALWTVVGYVSMLILFVFISIPMMDKRMVEKRPKYADHMKKVPMLFPSLVLIFKRNG